jgi:hypothetical protein
MMIFILVLRSMFSTLSSKACMVKEHSLIPKGKDSLYS